MKTRALVISSGWAMAAALWLAACSSTPAVGPVPATIGADVVADAAPLFGSDLGAVADAPALDTTAPIGDVQTQVDTAAPLDVAPVCPGGAGCPCSENGNCQAALCIDGANGKVCAATCVDSCPVGFACVPVTAGTDLTSYCMPRFLHLCDPCASSKDCASLGITDAVCVAQGKQGSYCGSPCGSGCPTGYGCKSVTAVEGASVEQCVKLDDAGGAGFGTCPCSAAASAKKLQTTCAQDHLGADGKSASCKGLRTCEATGLSACSAPEPTAEVCNGVDDDCDGKTDGVPCSDDSPCTTDTCGGGAGCLHTPASGAACDDGSACTQGDACVGGVCVAGQPVACGDGNPCTNDSCDVAKGCTTTAADGVACDADGSACSQGDVCAAGKCAAGQAIVCDDSNACTIDTCDPKTGACVFEAADAGSACSDGSACTQNDGCIAGKCKGKQVACDDSNPCSDDSCNPALGCQYVDANVPCNDGNPCTIGDLCAGGGCAPGKAKVCSSGDACTVAKCNILDGSCKFTAQVAGTACDDGLVCTGQDGCQDGSCVGKPVDCADGNPCTDDSCDSKSGCTHAPGTSKCDDGNACTQSDVCSGGTCKGDSASCDDGNPCTSDGCNVKTGCTHLPGSGACDDANACTKNDSCGAGGLCGGVPVACDDGNVCTQDACDVVKGCAYSATAGNCNDNNACTTEDTCGGGLCGGKAVSCDDGNACSQDLCDVVKGCTYSATAGNCSDNNACTTEDTCGGGICGGKAVACDDGNPCTQDDCDKASGCKQIAASGPCDDGSACTSGDACSGGKCAGSAVACDDGNACTLDQCDPTQGCLHPPVADGAVCGAGQSCLAGSCKSDCTPGSQTFNYSGKIDAFVVPSCAKALTVQVWGAQGGTSTGGSLGGKGAKVEGTLAVTPGATVSILVGQQAASAPYPCGGGGGSFVALGSTAWLVAGGGGGGYSSWANTGQSTVLATSGVGNGGAAYNTGGGGGGFTNNGNPAGGGGKSFLNGGAGGTRYPVNEPNCSNGGFGGGGGSSMNGNFTSGGGGGYDGGNSGNGNASTGGTSYIRSGVSGGTHTPAINSGNGKVVVSW